MHRRITHKGIKFGVTALCVLWLLVYAHFRLPCLFRTLFGFPCPACGMTHAFYSALHLDFVSAFRYNPMFWAVPVLYLYLLYDGRLFQNKRRNAAVLAVIGAGFVLSYAARLFLRVF